MPEKQNEKQSANTQTAKQGIQTAANAAFGPLGGTVGGKAADLASKTKSGQKVLNRAGNLLNSPTSPLPPALKNKGMKGSIANAMNRSNYNNKSDTPKINEKQNATTNESVTSKGGTGFKKRTMFSPGGMFGNNSSLQNDYNSEEQQVSGKINSFFKKNPKILVYIIGGVSAALLSVIMLLIVASIVLAPIIYANQLLNNIKSGTSTFFEKLGNIAKCGFMSDTECDKKLENKFYDTLVEVHDDYYKKYNVKINMSLLTATLTYYNLDSAFDDDDAEVIVDEDGYVAVVDEGGKTTSNYVDFKKSKKNIKKLATKMISDPKKTEVTEAAYNKNGEPLYNEDGTAKTITKTIITYSLDLEKYRKYLEEEFIKDYYFNGKDDSKTQLKVKQVVEDIYNRIDFYEYAVNENWRKGVKNSLSNVSVTITNCDGSKDLETVTLYDYVQGVLYIEAGISQSEEFLKAMSIVTKNYLFAVNGAKVDDIPTNMKIASCQMKQLFCNAKEGCHSLNDGNDPNNTSDYWDSYVSGPDSSGKYYLPPMNETSLEKVNSIIDETFSLYLVKDNNFVVTQYRASCTMACNPSTNIMDQAVAINMAKSGKPYRQILESFYTGELKTVVTANFSLMNENGADGYVKVINGVFHYPTISVKPAGTDGTRGSGTIYNAGYNMFFEARLYAFVETAKSQNIIITVPTGRGAYRLYADQAYYYCCYSGEGVGKYCAAKGCNNGNVAAKPGSGRHGWGLAADLIYSLNPGGPAQAINWAHQHAAEFGLRFTVSSEDWHIEPTEVYADLTTLD